MQTMNFKAIPTPKGPEESSDPGFGAVVSTASGRRLLNPDGSFNVRRDGLPWSEVVSLYHAALVAGWPLFLAWVAIIYVGINVVFTAAFALAGAGAIVGPASQSVDGLIARAFFLSVETFATIGYGNLAPQGLLANWIMTVESFVGILAQALITGLVFARFARPTAAVTFSRRAVVAPFKNGRALMMRMANRRKNELIELTATLSFSYVEQVGGESVRRYRPLPLDRAKVTFFPLAWTIVHPITPESPLWGLSPEQLEARDAEFLLLLSGIDDGFAATVHARTSYKAAEVVWDHKFTNIFNPAGDDGVLSMDISRLDEVQEAR
ncbi:MAG: transporter [Gemmatimonadetes bacterium]|nr:transporter [Gemmatimonadota bacterium]